MTEASLEHIDRRRFLVRAGVSAMSVGLVAGLPAVARACDILGLSDSRVWGGVPRPFNILAFGDSVMWGQGLLPTQKFATLVRDWAQTQMPGRVVPAPFFLAHSGAIIEPNAAQDKGVFGGEVPNSYPSITGQVWRALDALNSAKPFAPEEVDLILLNGGINDVNLRHILDPSSSADQVREITGDRMGTRMRYLLPIVTGAFPNAKVAVVGYFKVVSDESDLTVLASALAALGLLVGQPVAGPVLMAAIRPQLIAQSNAFYDESTTQLRAAVDAENARTPNRCVFVDPNFDVTNAYAAPNRLLFLVGENDPSWTARQAQCAAAGESLNPICSDAAMGHPNIAGAQRFATAIIGRVARFLPDWQGLRRMVACIDGSAGRYTVLTRDASTQAPVAGTVTLADGTKVPTNAAFSHTFPACTGVTKTRTSSRDVDIEPGTCETLSIEAPGFLGISLTVK